jgi:hypothetical protein
MPDMSTTELIVWFVCAPLGLVALVLGGLGVGVWWMRQPQKPNALHGEQSHAQADTAAWANANYDGISTKAERSKTKDDDDDEDEESDDDGDGSEEGDNGDYEGGDTGGGDDG